MSPANELAWHAMRRSVREGWKGFRLPPMLLDGPPGIGKSHWARKLGDLLVAPAMVVEAGSEGASFGLVGSQRGWSGAELRLELEMGWARTFSRFYRLEEPMPGRILPSDEELAHAIERNRELIPTRPWMFEPPDWSRR